MPPRLTTRLLIGASRGTLELTPERAGLPLPKGLEPGEQRLTYGPYLYALSNFLAQNSCEALIEALSRHSEHHERTLSLDAVRSIDIISRKHGALYDVAEVRLHMGDIVCSFALNSAMSPLQQSFIEREFHLLDDLWNRFGLPFLPRPYFLGEVPLRPEPHGRQVLRLLLAEWFGDYHELHLSLSGSDTYPVIKLWDTDQGESTLSPDETRRFYHKASSILTSYLDEGSFKQIYPWHHAAGDFIMRRSNGEVDVRMVTARDYRSLMSSGSIFEERWIAIAHFILNLSLRMRLDRLDGTGELTWAPSFSLLGVLSGFLESWAKKAQKSKDSLPPAHAVLHVLRSFTVEELIPLTELVLEDGLIEADEGDFLRARVQEHVLSLYRILHEEVPLEEY